MAFEEYIGAHLSTLALPLALLVAAGCSSNSKSPNESVDAASTTGDTADGAPGTGGSSGAGTGGRDANVDGNSITGGGGTPAGSGGISGTGGTSIDAGGATADGAASSTDGSAGIGGNAGAGAGSGVGGSDGSEGGIEAGTGGSTAVPDAAMDGNTAGTDGASSCSEAPCKLTLPQCGCGASEQCSLVSGSRACVTEGTVQEGQACGASARCAPGLLCVPLSQSIATCEKLCSSDAECESPGGLCQETLQDGQGGTIPNATLCSENCDPISNNGCPVAGTSCHLVRESGVGQRTYTDCGLAGTQTQGAVCDPSLDECAPGYACIIVAPNQANCRKYCAFPFGSCPGATCVEMNPAAVVGGTSYGVCL